MTRETTPTFVTEFELQTTPSQRVWLEKRLNAARMVYNACLGESLKRLRVMRISDAYKAAMKEPRKFQKKSNPRRTQLFREARDDSQFSEYSLHKFAGQFNHSWLGEHLDINTIQKLATRSFHTTQRYAFNKGGKPRFKGSGRIRSVEGKSNASGIRYRNGSIYWMGQTFPIIIMGNDPVHKHALTSPVKYVRLIRKEIRGHVRWYAQLVCEGMPYRKLKHVVGKNIVGLDIGPSTVAIVSDETAWLHRFCDDITDKSQEIAKLQRKIDRQRRLGNPENYELDRFVTMPNGIRKRKKGKIKKGRNTWNRSQRMQFQSRKLREAHRKLSAHRKSLHGKMVNDILSLGKDIRIEKLSYKAFQKRFGKSVGKRSPGMFVETLRRKAARAGGKVDEFNTWTTKLSQLCHGCGSVVKKPLSQRFHICDCGIVQQRDLYSAFLAMCVSDNRLDARVAGDRYPGLDFTLRAAASRNKSVIGQALPAALLHASQNGSSASVECISDVHWIVH